MPYKFNPFTGTFDDSTPGPAGVVAAANSGTALLPGITFATDPNTGIYNPGADQLAVSTGGTGRLFIGDDGRVGVGGTGIGASIFTARAATNQNITIKSSSGEVALEAINDANNANVPLRYLASQYVFNTANTERLRITSAGLVGIGTSSPDAQLQIVKNSDYTQEIGSGLNIVDGTNDVKLNCGVDATNNISFIQSLDPGTSNVTRPLTLNPNGGRVGIGTVVPNGTLHVVGDTSALGEYSVLSVSDVSDTTKAVKIAYDDVNDVGVITAIDAGTAYKNLALQPISGRVGIGTASPQSLLNISTASTAGDQNVLICGTAATGLTGSHALYLGAYGSTLYGCKIKSIYNYAASANTSLSFEISTAGTLTEAARIDASGRLLVGTSSARSNFFNTTLTSLFQVEGANDSNKRAASIVYGNSGDSGPILALGKTRSNSLGGNTLVANGDQCGYITFQGADGTELVEVAGILAQVDGTPGANDMPGRLVFSTTADGASSPTERMRIDSSGNTAINQTSTSYHNGYATAFRTSNGSWIINHPNTITTGTFVEFGRYDNGTIGSITHTNASSVSYNTSSDYRLKENVTVVTDGITRLQQLKPSRFNFIADPGHTVDGFLAHEVQDIVPEAITGTKDEVDDDGNPVYQGIDQSKLVPLLTAALQEAIGRIETLEAEVSALKGA